MNRRSKTWLNKKKELELKEQEIKGDLDIVSDDMTRKIKFAVKASLITGGVFLAGYGLYKLLGPSKKQVEIPAKIEPQKEVKVKQSSGFNFKNLIFERLTIVLIKFIGSQMANLMDKKLGLEDNSTEED